MRTYSLWTRRQGVKPDGTRYDKDGWVKVSSEEPLTHHEALIVRSKHDQPSSILIYPSDSDPNGKRFRYCYCCCCGGLIQTDKPQGPDHDTNWGTCCECRPRIIRDWLKNGRHDKPISEADAHAYHDRYA